MPLTALRLGNACHNRTRAVFHLRINGGSLQATGSYASFLGHIRKESTHRLVGRRRDLGLLPPFLMPSQIATIKDDAACYDRSGRRWNGNLRFRLFWSLLEGDEAPPGGGAPARARRLDARAGLYRVP